MIRRGIVVAVDEKKAKVRVKFEDLDGMVSDWLPVVFPKTHKDKAYWLPDIGELVVVAFDEDGERVDGYILGTIYNREDTTPVQSIDKWHIRFSDGTKIEYDKSSGKLTVENPKQVILKVQNSITKETKTLQIKASSGSSLESPMFVINGDVLIQGNLFVSGNITSIGQTTAQGGLKTLPGGQTVFVDDLISKYNTHTHTDSSGGTTSPPDQQIP